MPEGRYSVRRSDRARRARLTVTREGEAVVVLPRRAPESLAHELVSKHRVWLDRQLARVREQSDRLDRRPPLGAGRLLVVGGTPYRIVVVARTSAPGAAPSRASVALRPAVWPEEPGLMEVRVPPGQSVESVLEAWLRREARKVLARRVADFAPVVGVSVPVLTIRSQVSRWGSASRSGRVSLNWRLILTPPEVLDYVVIHELAHLVVPGHSKRFWSLVRRHAPESDRARAWLREHHAELMAALD
jgi:predicted metal-dependent hydrolase